MALVNTATNTRVRVYTNFRKLVFYLPDVSVLKRDPIVRCQLAMLDFL